MRVSSHAWHRYPLSLYQSYALSTSVALPAHQPCAGERDRGFPHSSAAIGAKPRQAATRLDTARQAATGRDSGASHSGIMRCFVVSPAGIDKANAGIAILPLANFRQVHFHGAADRVRRQRPKPASRSDWLCNTTPGSRDRERFRKASQCLLLAQCDRQDSRSPDRGTLGRLAMAPFSVASAYVESTVGPNAETSSIVTASSNESPGPMS